MSRRVYIAGPMAGHDDLNIPAFEAAEHLLTARGYTPVSPHRVPPVEHADGNCPDYGYFPGEHATGHTSSACFMRPDIEALLTCDAIYLLDGWETSRGACVEAAVARAVGIPRLTVNTGCGAGCGDGVEEVPHPAMIDARHIMRQRDWSTRTFGPPTVRGPLGPLDHIRKELDEIEADPHDVGEWVDVIILAFDGAWRAGHEPIDILRAVHAKQARNELRTWPDWRGTDPDKAIEHVREATP